MGTWSSNNKKLPLGIQGATKCQAPPYATKKVLVLLKANSSGLCVSVGHSAQVREQVHGTGHQRTQTDL